MTQDTIVPEPLTNKTFFERLLPLLQAVESLELDIKELCEEGKDAELDVGLLKAIAKAKLKDKTDALQDKSQTTLDLIEEVLN